jgi:hypothetical protein
MRHAREGEHPECHDALATTSVFEFAASRSPHGWIAAFAGMTRVGLVGRDPAASPANMNKH